MMSWAFMLQSISIASLLYVLLSLISSIKSLNKRVFELEMDYDIRRTGWKDKSRFDK